MTDHHKQEHLHPRDWITYTLLWIAIFPATALFWRITSFVWLEESAKGKAADSKQTSLLKEESLTTDTTRVSRPSEHSNRLLRFFSEMSALKLVHTTATLMWFRLVLDTLSWTYLICVQVWDWFVIVIDALSIGIGGLSAAMLLLVFTQRSYNTFVMSRKMRVLSTKKHIWMYDFLYVLCACVAVCALLVGTFSLALMWKMLAYASMSFALLFAATCTVCIWTFVTPLRALAVATESDKLMHVAVRVTAVSIIALLSTFTTVCAAAVAYVICEDCGFSYVYYNVTTFDTLINLLCLTWSLKSGRKEYHYFCWRIHRQCFHCLGKSEEL